jgi:hypothetical protein
MNAAHHAHKRSRAAASLATNKKEIEDVCFHVDAICELLRLSGGAVINTAHVYALLEPLRVRLCNAHECLDELVQ